MVGVIGKGVNGGKSERGRGLFVQVPGQLGVAPLRYVVKGIVVVHAQEMIWHLETKILYR